MRLAKKEKKLLVPNSVHTRPGQENFEKYIKKIQKIIKPFPAIIFSENGNEIGRKREKKILVPNSVHTRPGQENSKKNSKKSQKIKKPLSNIIFCQNGMR